MTLFSAAEFVVHATVQTIPFENERYSVENIRIQKESFSLDGYSSHTMSRNQSFQQSSGVLELILKEHPAEDNDPIVRWDGVLTYY